MFTSGLRLRPELSTLGSPLLAFFIPTQVKLDVYKLASKFNVNIQVDVLIFGFRFGQFFLEPLFTESATERELNAVHSEHSKNVASDAWRINQLERHLADPNHDFHKFGTGNLSTLDDVPKSQGINIR